MLTLTRSQVDEIKNAMQGAIEYVLTHNENIDDTKAEQIASKCCEGLTHFFNPDEIFLTDDD